MPFVKKDSSKSSSVPTHAPSLFIGRTGELLFFIQNILKPEEPTHNILSISGQGGVGKSTLLNRFINEAHSDSFKGYCLTALVDERQATPLSMMEKFAEQLPIQGKFKKALDRYKEALWDTQIQRETLQETVLQRMPDFAGAAAQGIPIAGPLLGEGLKVTTRHLLEKYHTSQIQRDLERLADPIDGLTKIFVDELNQLVSSRAIHSSSRVRRDKRIILFFDTFEQLAAEAVPWFLDHLLEATIDPNIVLVIAGRNPIEHATPYDSKRWLSYFESDTIYSLSLRSFTEDESRAYLAVKGITDPTHIASIWQLSRGLPLYLGLLTSNPQGKVDPAKDVVDNFLRWIPEQEYIKRRLALDAALFSRPFNQDDLEIFTYLPQSESERHTLNHWLVEQPFVRSLDGRYLYHDLAKAQFQHHLYQLSPKNYYAIRNVLANHYESLLGNMRAEIGKKAYRTAAWLELVLALTNQLFALPDETSHIRAIEQILSAYKHTGEEQHREIVRTLREVSQERVVDRDDSGIQQIVKHLLQFNDADRNWDFQERLTAANFLIEKVAHTPSFPSDMLAYLYSIRGGAHAMLHKHQQSIEDLQHALALLDSTAYSDRGWMYFHLSEYHRAIAEFGRVLASDPNDAVAHSGRGVAYRRLKRYQEAIADFDHLRKKDPGKHRNYRSIGAIYERMNEYQQALAYYDQALERTSEPVDLYDTYTYRGRCNARFKRYKEAFEDFDRAVELYPKSSGAYVERGCAYLRLKDLEQARINFTRGLEVKPGDIDCNLMAEWTRLCQERADSEMPERLVATTADHPHTHHVHVCKGIALWLKGCFEEALAELEQTLPFWYESWGAFFWLAMTYASLGRDEEASEAIVKAFDAELFEMPPVLLAPLRWFEQDRPDFYKNYAEPLLKRYEV